MKKIAIVVGHTESSPGSLNIQTQKTEYQFNCDLAEHIMLEAFHRDYKKIQFILIYRTSYQTLPDDINNQKPDYIISLHANAFNRKVSGCETLYHHASSRGFKMAKILQKHIVKALDTIDRGVKPKTIEDRGGYLLKKTHAPCVIAEPFFLDNNNDYENARSKYNRLVNAYLDAIEEIVREV